MTTKTPAAPLIDIHPDHWAIVQGILQKHVPRYEVLAFGSRARWTAKPYSDLDLAIITDQPLSLELSAALTDDFSESDLPWKVDVVDWATTSESFRQIIEKDKVVVQKGLVGDGGSWTLKSIEELKAPANGSIAIGPFGSRMKSDCYVPSGVQVIRGTNIGDTRVLTGEMVCITPELADSLGNAIVHADDLVFPHRGSIGLVGIVPRDGADRYALSSSLMKLTCDRKQVDTLFLFYFFRSTVGRHELLKNASTVGTPGIGQPLASLRSINVLLPPLSEQKAIVHILGSLDDKIELNRRSNETLEAMARALFKDWFIDFGPVRAKMESREPYLAPEVWRQFPDSLDKEGKPEGWSEQPLTSFIDLIGGGTPKTSVAAYWDGDIPWFSVVDAPSPTDVFVIGTQKSISQAGLDSSSARLLPENTTIISARGTVGKLALIGRPMAMNQSCYGVMGRDGWGPYFTYFQLKDAVGRLQANTHGSVFDTITRATFDAVRSVKPPTAIGHEFEEAAMPWMAQIKANILEIQSLASLRELLLPKLLSGELRIKDAEKWLGDQA